MRRATWGNSLTVHSRADATARRVTAVGAFFLFAAAAVVASLFYLQVVKYDAYASLAARLQDTTRALVPERGSIYLREGADVYPIVSNRDYYLLYADPRQVEDAARVVDTLARVLELKGDAWKPMSERLSRRRDPYAVLYRKATREQVEKIRAAQLRGIGDQMENYRYYPEPAFSGQILGFVRHDGETQVGQYGLEGYFDRELRGTPGRFRSVTDAFGRPLGIGERQIEEARDGENFVLTLDRTVQRTACEKIAQGVADFDAVGGTLIIQRPQTGDIVAMCSVPNFDPESYAEVPDPGAYNNPAIFYAYEPGSVFKPITMAAAIDRGLVKPTDTYEDTGEIKLSTGGRIRNADLQAHGVQTMVQVLEKSLNTGAVHVVRKLGKESFRRYVQDFGFGQKSGITLDTEVAGDIRPLDRRGEIYAMTASFGQGITVTPLQLTAAYGALANGGVLMRPRIVAERGVGEPVPLPPQAVRQVVTARNASTVTGMLVQAVEGVYDHKAKLPGYTVAGKTGTAQIADPAGGYGQNVNHTFIGYFPAYDAQFVVLVKLDSPTKVKHAADSATLVFRGMAEFLLKYYQIPPEG